MERQPDRRRGRLSCVSRLATWYPRREVSGSFCGKRGVETKLDWQGPKGPISSSVKTLGTFCVDVRERKVGNWLMMAGVGRLGGKKRTEESGLLWFLALAHGHSRHPRVGTDDWTRSSRKYDVYGQLHCLGQTSYLFNKWLNAMWAYPTVSKIVAVVGIRAWLEALTDYSRLVSGLARLKGATWGPGS